MGDGFAGTRVSVKLPPPGHVKVYDDLVVKIVAFADVPADQDAVILVAKTLHPDAPDDVFAVDVPVVKAIDGGKEERFILCPVATPNKKDGQGTVIPPDVIRKAAHQYLADYRMMDDLHNLAPLLGGKSPGVPVESYVLHQDTTFQSPTGPRKVPAGSWMMGVKVTDDDVWARIKSGAIKGLSMWGRAIARTVPERDVFPVQVAKTAAQTSRSTNSMVLDDETKKEVEAVAKSAVSAALEPVTKTLDEVRKTIGELSPIAKTLNGVDLAKLTSQVETVSKTVEAIEKDLGEPVRKALRQQANPERPQMGSVLAAIAEKHKTA